MLGSGMVPSMAAGVGLLAQVGNGGGGGTLDNQTPCTPISSKTLSCGHSTRGGGGGRDVASFPGVGVRGGVVLGGLISVPPGVSGYRTIRGRIGEAEVDPPPKECGVSFGGVAGNLSGSLESPM